MIYTYFAFPQYTKMSSRHADISARYFSTVSKRLFIGGLAILFAGLISAFLIYFFASDQTPDIALLSLDNQRLHDYNLERMSGKAAVYLSRFSDWLDSMLHGKRLAYSVAAVSVFVSIVCFWFAELLAEDDHVKD